MPFPLSILQGGQKKTLDKLPKYSKNCEEFCHMTQWNGIFMLFPVTGSHVCFVSIWNCCSKEMNTFHHVLAKNTPRHSSAAFFGVFTPLKAGQGFARRLVVGHLILTLPYMKRTSLLWDRHHVCQIWSVFAKGTSTRAFGFCARINALINFGGWDMNWWNFFRMVKRVPLCSVYFWLFINNTV